MRTEAAGLRLDGDRVVGVNATGPDGPVEINARLVVAADGRNSQIRAVAGFTPRGTASPIDVLWFRLPRIVGEPVPFFHGGSGTLICIDRGEFWQIASVLPAGTWDRSVAGLAAMRARVGHLEPRFVDRLHHVTLDDVQLLRVRLERLRRWHRDGFLVIGDAAHAMSPAGGVGINLAVQDAVAAGRLLGPVLGAGRRPTERDLARVQRRRAWPTWVTQAVQRGLQPSLLADVPDGALPLRLRALVLLPWLRHAVGRLVGLGARPEHLTSDRK
jgi:2-polyprenyl-6-methoxyphenol hydroxylase-like FAD-dependent oxidoreductase